MSKDIRTIRKECCDIWNNLKDKTKMIDYLIESKRQIADLKTKLAELNKEPLNCSQLEKGMSLCVIQKSKIAELKAKLAEKDKAIENWETMYRSVMQSCHNGIEEDKRLEKLLAEKDKELTRLMKNWKISRSQQRCLYYKLLEKQDQDKISFAVEQLEKVKNFVIRQLFITTKDCSDLDEAEAKGCNELIEETINEIDNQINEFKKEMK